jgi:hypothetical protein
VRVPEEAGDGVAKVTLSFADWKTGNVKSTTHEVALAARGAKPKAGDDPR